MPIRIGVISDTHYPERVPYLPYDELAEIFADCDAIVHCGDIETMRVIDELGRIAPVYAVRGDDEIDTQSLPLKRVVEIGGKRIGLHHAERPFWVEMRNKIGKKLGFYDGIDWDNVESWLLDEFKDDNVDAIIFGHFHIPYIKLVNGVFLFSSGSVFKQHIDSTRWRSRYARHWFRRFTSRLQESYVTHKVHPATVGIVTIDEGGLMSAEHIELAPIDYTIAPS